MTTTPNLAPNTTTPPDRAENLAFAVADALGLLREAADVLALALAPEPPPEPAPGPGDPEIRARIQRIRDLKRRGKSLSAALVFAAAFVAVPAFAAPEAPGTPVVVSGELVARAVTVSEPGETLSAVLTVEVVCGTTAPAECVRFRVVCGHSTAAECSEPEIGSAVRIVARLRSDKGGAPELVFERFR